jgi:hypothetical protein
MSIDQICDVLSEMGAEEVASYRRKLSENSGNAEVFEDLTYEGVAAFNFLLAGFGVRMSESPDLEIKLHDSVLFAEVKHFRYKIQDKLDELNTREALKNGYLATYGNTFPTEEKDPWDEVVEVARKKVSQYKDGSPNVLVLASSSGYCIDDAIMPTAIHEIDKGSRTPTDVGLRKLNGVLLLSSDYSGKQNRNAWFFETENAFIGLGETIRTRLNDMRVWRRPT